MPTERPYTSMSPKHYSQWFVLITAVLEHLYCTGSDWVWRSLAELTRSAPAPGTKPLL